MRVFGKVKSFDRTTGTGCAISDSGAQAAFGSEALKPFGLAAIDEGVALAFELTLERGRLTVAKIYEIAGKGPQPGGMRDTPPTPPVSGPRVKGRVLWFDVNKGFGFVMSKDVEGDVLLHRSVLDAIGIDCIREGAALEFDFVQKLKGKQITRIHAVLAPEQPLLPPAAPPTGGCIVIWRNPAADIDIGNVVIGPNLLDPFKDIYLGRAKGFGFAEHDDDTVWENAVCKWFSRPKGFGFLVAGDEDVFVHMDVLRACGIRELRTGQRVRVRVNRTERGANAAEVELDYGDNAGHA